MDKTEVLEFGTENSSKVTSHHITVPNIIFACHIFDQHLQFESHFSKIIQSCFLSSNNLEILVHTLVH